jgi:FtsZ-interacting cell division protein ZipA
MGGEMVVMPSCREPGGDLVLQALCMMASRPSLRPSCPLITWHRRPKLSKKPRDRESAIVCDAHERWKAYPQQSMRSREQQRPSRTRSPPILSSDHLAPTTEVVEEAPASEPSKRKPLAFVKSRAAYRSGVSDSLRCSREMESVPATKHEKQRTTEVVEEAPASEPSKRKPLAFWMVFVALCFSCFVGCVQIGSQR